MLGPLPMEPATENSALIVRGTQQQGSDNRSRKGRPWCDHCKKNGHTRDACWKIHVTPVDWKPTRYFFDKKSRGNHAAAGEGTATTEASPFTKEQLEALQKMLSQLGQSTTTNPIGTRSLAHKGNFLIL